MAGEALRPEDIIEVSPDPDNPTAFRIQVLLRDDLDPSTVEVLQSNEVPPTSETPPEPINRRWRPPQESTKTARVGPIEVRVDMAPIVNLVERVFSGALPAFQHIAQKVTGKDFAQLVFEIAEQRREPENSLEELIARTLLGRTRFDRINDDD